MQTLKKDKFKLIFLYAIIILGDRMKEKILWIIIGLLSVFVIGVIFMFGNKKLKIDNIKSLHFSYSNGYMMDAYTTYDITLEDNKYYVTIKPYGIPEEESQKIELNNDQIEKIISILNEYEVYKWNNFHESDKYVLDGDSFSFSMYTLDDKYISASGYMRYPKNYGEVEKSLDDILGSLYVQKVE